MKFWQFKENNQRGSGVILTLFILSLVMAITLTFYYMADISLRSAVNSADVDRSSYYAVSGVERAMAILDNVAVVYSGKDPDSGKVDFLPESFSPKHFVNSDTGELLFDENGIFRYYDEIVADEDAGRFGKIEVKIINHTGKFDANRHSRAQDWDGVTFGLTPQEINLAYLLGEGELPSKLNDVASGDKWFSSNEIAELIYKKSTDRTEAALSNLPIITHSPRGIIEKDQQKFDFKDEVIDVNSLSKKELELYNGLKNRHLHHANTYLNEDGSIGERIDVQTLRTRVAKIPFGYPVMKNKTLANRLINYWRPLIPRYQKKMDDLLKKIKVLEQKIIELYEALGVDADTARNAISQSYNIANKIRALTLKMELVNSYLSDDSISDSYRSNLEAQKSKLESQISELKNKNIENEELLGSLVGGTEIRSLQNQIWGLRHEYNRAKFVVDAYKLWVNDNILIFESYHKKIIEILTDNGKSPIPSLTRILEYYAKHDRYAYMEFLANLRDYFDGGDFVDEYLPMISENRYGLNRGLSATTVSNILLPPDIMFNTKMANSDEVFRGIYFYCGNEIGLALAQQRLSFVPRWQRNVRNEKDGIVIYYKLFVDVYYSSAFLNSAPEYRYTSAQIICGNIQLRIKDINGNTTTKKINSKSTTVTLNSSSGNQWLTSDTNQILATFDLGEIKEEAIFTQPTIKIEKIEETNVYVRWAGENGNYLADKVWLYSITNNGYLGLLNLEVMNPTNDSMNNKISVLNLNASDPMCNTTTDKWNITTQKVDNLDEIRLVAPPIGGLPKIFIRNGYPWSLWELGNIHRGQPHRFLNLFEGEENPDGSYEKGDWELFDHLMLYLTPTDNEQQINGEDNEEDAVSSQIIEHGKINPNSSNNLVWETMLKSVRLGKWNDLIGSFPEIYPPEEFYGDTFYQNFRAIKGTTSQELGREGNVAMANSVANTLASVQIKPLMSRGRLALYYASEFEKLAKKNDTNLQKNEVLGKLIPLMQTRYQYFEIISIGKESKELAKVDRGGDGKNSINKAQYLIRMFVERDAFTGKYRPLTYEISVD